MENQIISGVVILSPSTLPLLGVKVEFWDSTNGWIASTATTLEGQFILSVDEKYFDIPSPPDPGFQYVFKVFKDNIQIGQVSYDDVFDFDEVEINISEPLYDTLVTDKLEDASQKKFINISGKVTNESGVPSFPGMAVRLIDLTAKKGTEVLRVPIEVGGRYNIRLNSKVFDSTTTLYKHAFRLEVVAINDFGSFAVKYATTNIYYNWEDYNEIDIVIHPEEPVAKDEFWQLNHALELTQTSIELLYSPEEVSTNDIITLLVARTGIAPDIWERFVNAVRHAQDIIVFLEIDPEDPNIDSITQLIQLTMYGLIRPSGAHDNPLDKIDVNQLQNTLTGSIDAYYIQEEWNEQAVLTFATNLYKAYRTKKITTSNVSGEDFTIETVLDAVFGDTGAQQSYINLCFENYDTTEEFWDAFETENGSTITQKVQNGLLLNSITGSQPEIITALADEDIPQLALNTLEDWITLIEDISDTSERLCVPALIKENTESDEEAIEQYAAKLKELMQNAYPLTNMAAHLDEDIIPDEDIRDEVVTFIDNNPQYDIRLVKAEDIDNGDYDLDGITDVAGVKDALLPFQRLLKVTDGEPELVMALLKDGIGSATEIVNIPFEDFDVAYSPYLRSADLTQILYGRAITISSISSWTFVTQYRAFLDLNMYVMPLNRYNAVAEPNLETLFHAGSYCRCNECMSLYSPAAYYTDILNFLKKFAPVAYTELVRRRPDLIHIDLTCKNTNTALPYIDLVNELLENTILAHVPSPPTIIKSYQTQGVTNELNAYPEHVIKNNSGIYEDITSHHYVYDTVLPNAIYPHNLPFSLPIEETRAYLQHMGISRYDAMRLFRSGTETISPFTEPEIIGQAAINAESLKLTLQSLKIITDTTLADPWKYYGLPNSTTTIIDPSDSSLTITGTWENLLTDRLDVLLHYGQFEYQQLLEILTSSFINPYNIIAGRRSVAIVSTDPEHPDTCELKKLKLDFISGFAKDAFLKKLIRFVRLIKTGKLSIHQWDILFRSLGISDISLNDYNLAVKGIQLSDKLGIATELLSCWWHQADTERYSDYNAEAIAVKQSVYDKVFRSRALVGSDLFPEGGPASVPYNNHAAAIASVCKVKEEEFIQLLAALGISDSANMSLLIISKVYIIGQVCKNIKCSVKDFITFATFAGLQTSTAPLDYLAQSNTGLVDFLADVLNLYGLVQNSPFIIPEYDYLLRNSDERLVFVPKVTTIAAFYTTLRNELQKYPHYEAPGSADPDVLANAQAELKLLLNVIFQEFVKEFDIPLEWVELFVTSYDMETATVDDNIQFILDEFTSSTVSIEDADFKGYIDAENDFEQLFTLYRQIHKYAFIAKRLHMGIEEFVYAYTTPTAVLFDYTELPTLADAKRPVIVDNTSSFFLGFIRTCLCIEVRDKYQFDKGDLVNLIKAVYTPDKEVWLEILIRNTEWPNLFDLIDDGNGDPGILGEDWPDGFLPTEHKCLQRLLSILDIMYWCRRTGLNPAAFQSVLQGAPALDNSYKVMQAAKAKHGESEWFAVAKPIRDVLRIKQRDALLGFVLYYPALVNARKWQKINDVYAYLLIDVEMEPCMLTSRIKQGISSVQLFVDRILLGLEYVYSTTTRINMLPVYIEQWESWRKWYRVWEANRKIFLYPENWIEPELRDDKTAYFADLEQALSKGDVTEDLVSDAMLEYLYKLDSVAKLEPAGYYYDPQTQITHVFARTIGGPHTYYYRQLKEEEWNAWEEVDAQIEGEHLAPVFWKGKLHIFWITFVDKKGKVDINMETVDPGGYLGRVWTNHVAYNPKANFSFEESGPGLWENRVLEVRLNWSEYKDGKWLKQKMSKEPAVIKFYPSMEADYRAYIANGPAGNTAKFNFLNNRGDLDIMEFVKSRFFMHHTVDASNSLYIKLTYPLSYSFDGEKNEDYAFYLHGFKFSVDALEPVVWRQPEISSRAIYQWQRPTPLGNYLQNSKLVKAVPYTSANPSQNNKLFLDAYDSGGYWDLPAYFSNSYTTALVKVRHGNLTRPMLKDLPYNKHILTIDAGFTGHPFDKQFFFKDDKHTFFVKKVEEPISRAYITGTISIWIGQPTYRMENELVMNDPIALLPEALSGPEALTENNWVLQLRASLLQRGKYQFYTFYHAHVKNFIKALIGGGIQGFMDLRNQVKTDTINFSGNYIPNLDVVKNIFPSDRVDFDFGGPYAVYNWELFFHAPMMIAARLSTNQQFAEARKWMHYVFDPTSNLNDQGTTSTNKQRFWRFRPFYEEAGRPVQTLNDLLDLINQNNANAVAQVRRWENNPFKPHTIARMRVLAYMKYVVMKYLDNLIAWGDQLFSRDTIESINEATQLYILAANILGDRPREIPQRAYTAPKSFYELAGSLDAFSNAMVQIENYIDPSLPPTYTHSGNKATTTTTDMGKMYYFCLSSNPKLLGYWDTIADRLFKIRNCMNIDGQVRQLPLFEPPIDPAMLVRAAAAGMSTAQVMASLSAPPGQYRFGTMLQKANEICSDVKALGSAILSALEKRDAEELALLRSTHEIQLLEKVKELKEIQVREAQANIDVAIRGREISRNKLNYYSTRLPVNQEEAMGYIYQLQVQRRQMWAGIIMGISQLLAAVPQIHGQLMASGVSFGGMQISSIVQAGSTVMSILAQYRQVDSTLALQRAGYIRRAEDFFFQATNAQQEIRQADQQIIAAEIRKSIAEKDVQNQSVQIENAKAVDEYMRNKYTNQQLYEWMISQISTTYFQSYQLAYETAKKAEACYDYELPKAVKPADGIIKFGYWDSLKKGLMAGERLQYDLRKLDLSYLENNKWELELTKHISLCLIDPEALMDLKTTGTCEINIPEIVYDLDYPGHYNRRIKTVAISIPCVAGPYTTINATLTQTANKIREVDSNLIEPVSGKSVFKTLAASSAQNDSGMFELNFRNERYLPFEYSGAISTWSLMLSDKVNDDLASPPATIEQLRLFDFNTITDVILHIKYTAINGNGTFKAARMREINNVLNGSVPGTITERLSSLNHEFSNAWNLYASTFAEDTDATIDIELDINFFPFFVAKKELEVLKIHVYLRTQNILGGYQVILTNEDDVEWGSIINLSTLSGSEDYYSGICDVSEELIVSKELSQKVRFQVLNDTSAPVNITELVDEFYFVVEYKAS